MEKPSAMAQTVAFLRMGWVSIVLLSLALVAVGAGICVRTEPAWTKWPEIRAYNEGVNSFNMPPGTLPATATRPEEYPIERAGALWRLASETSDKKLRSLALYNLGTLFAREAWAFRIISDPRSDMSQAFLWLGEAIRNDPANEAAKFNLELVEASQAREGEREGAPGPGYAPGAVESKGY